MYLYCPLISHTPSALHVLTHTHTWTRYIYSIFVFHLFPSFFFTKRFSVSFSLLSFVSIHSISISIYLFFIIIGFYRSHSQSTRWIALNCIRHIASCVRVFPRFLRWHLCACLYLHLRVEMKKKTSWSL